MLFATRVYHTSGNNAGEMDTHAEVANCQADSCAIFMIFTAISFPVPIIIMINKSIRILGEMLSGVVR